LRRARIWFDRRSELASSSAASLASVPLVVRKTLASGMSETPAITSASSTIGRFRYRVDEWMIRSACSATALVTSGSACAVIVVRMPPKKSR
jgi:hypothetical protein